MIIGSANINDRSLSGERDSEVAIYIEDGEPEDTPFGYKVSPGIHQFRVDLFNEHFGETGAKVGNFMDLELWEECEERARRNTLVYREVFGCYPDDTMRRFGQIEEVFGRRRVETYGVRKEEIKGHVVELPLKFLEEENLTLTGKEKEYYFLPNIFFT